MLKIEREVVEVSLEYFVEHKGESPFSEWRQKAKNIAFGQIFGRSPISFALKDLTLAWTEVDADNYIESSALYNQLEKINDDPNFYENSEFERKLIVCASDIQKKFFIKYPGLKERMDVRFNEAKEYGFMKGVYGMVKHMPEYFFSGKEDRKYFGKMFSNLKNITANATIQHFEAAVMYRIAVNIDQYLIKNKMKSVIIGMVHDSIDMYVHKEEEAIVLKLIHDEFTRMEPEYNGIPLDYECKISNDIYKEGKKVHL